MARRDRNRIALESDLLSAAMFGIDNIQQYGVPVVVTLNSFVSDTDAENAFIEKILS